jgi:hypothetical protein
MEDIIMSKWRKPLKNKKRFDARYFMKERSESAINEVLDQKVRLKRKREAEDLMAHLNYEKTKDFHSFSFDSWLNESEDVSVTEEAYDHQEKDDSLDEEEIIEEKEITEEGIEEG